MPHVSLFCIKILQKHAENTDKGDSNQCFAVPKHYLQYATHGVKIIQPTHDGTLSQLKQGVNCNPSTSKASRDVANLMKEKICIPLYMVSKILSVCPSICLSICLSVTNFDPNYLKTNKTEWAKKIRLSCVPPQKLV